jgi:hypothetical protein
MILLPCSDRFNARYLISYADVSVPRTSPPLLLQEFSRKRVVAQPCWASFGPRRPMHHYAAQAIGLPPVEKISARLSERAHSRRNFRAFSYRPNEKRGTLCAKPERRNSAVSSSRATSFAHWRAWELLPTPYRSSFPEGADESEGIISSPSPMSQQCKYFTNIITHFRLFV